VVFAKTFAKEDDNILQQSSTSGTSSHVGSPISRPPQYVSSFAKPSPAAPPKTSISSPHRPLSIEQSRISMVYILWRIIRTLICLMLVAIPRGECSCSHKHSVGSCGSSSVGCVCIPRGRCRRLLGKGMQWRGGIHVGRCHAKSCV